MSLENEELDEPLPTLSNLYRIVNELTDTVTRLTSRIELLEANMAIAKSGQPSLPWK